MHLKRVSVDLYSTIDFTKEPLKNYVSGSYNIKFYFTLYLMRHYSDYKNQICCALAQTKQL